MAAPRRAAPATEAVAEEEGEGEGFTSVGRGGRTVAVSAETLFKDLQAIQESRGKKVIYSLYNLNNPNESILEHRPRSSNSTLGTAIGCSKHHLSTDSRTLSSHLL